MYTFSHDSEESSSISSSFKFRYDTPNSTSRRMPDFSSSRRSKNYTVLSQSPLISRSVGQTSEWVVPASVDAAPHIFSPLRAYPHWVRVKVILQIAAIRKAVRHSRTETFGSFQTASQADHQGRSADLCNCELHGLFGHLVLTSHRVKANQAKRTQKGAVG